MLRSMYSGISGMKNFQAKLDVLGNNIANVNTYGFKKGRTTFKDLVSQQISGASAPTQERGGVNPKQIGLGAQLSTIDTIDTQGSLQTTGRPLDLALSGDGFFVVSDGPNNYFTRAGNFYLDQEGTLVNADGLKLLDTAGDEIDIPTDAESFSIGNDGSVTYIQNGVLNANPQQIGIAKFANNGGLEKVGSNLYQQTTNSGAVDINALAGPGTQGAGEIVAGALEMSNVDLSEEFTEMIVAQRGFQANTRIITTSDEILQELVNLKR
ncbi:flagellar basal body rod protein FlgG [Pseudalkalibacillus salsuginis]|uniref:flagellar basal body rod protein FlgG n=1 Tax=Pseudalkalibacillus salsuginis TaxID=2910972 RepID=UPI001F24001F|nr:flagellar basal body rod protein FlgG [Pseudalkalibacillus salsuginis]MCF6410573.1 flagellar basal body rod protein FlgG [Pseudalkalibacillus salsuginis]